MSNKKLFGILGRNIGHSFSPKYFNRKFLKENINAEFVLFDLQNIELLPEMVNSKSNLSGLSVTIPYKQEVFKYLQGVSNEAERIGAVNCIKITKDGLIGYNTDVIGFKNSLLPLIAKKTNLSALILGTGGASKAVAFVLNELNIPFKFVSRTKNDGILTYREINQSSIAHNLLIINTTPLGMFPKTDTSPDIPYQYLTENHILFDLIYNPEETRFLKEGKRAGALTKNGLEMLQFQAEAAWKIWQTG
jgi:shikimate dehydrogenase